MSKHRSSPIPTAALHDLLSWVDVFWGHHEVDGVRNPTQAKAVIRELLEARDVLAECFTRHEMADATDEGVASWDDWDKNPGRLFHPLTFPAGLVVRARALLPQDHT